MKREKKAITDILSKRFDVLFAYLFGSHVKGYANSKSEWDVAIYFKQNLKQNGRWPEFELEADLSHAIGAQAQVIILNRPLPPVFGFEIIKHGFVLIDRNLNLRVDFENRILRQYYDWQYYLNGQMEAERHRSRI
ncbi:MAG: type VII toxin-antitoxin system MntA family adenylyltransferase antitoxin [Thermodesulfobacteriota bacterium]